MDLNQQPATKADIQILFQGLHEDLRQEFATKADIQILLQELRENLRVEFASKADIQGLQQATQVEIQDLRETNKTDIQQLAQKIGFFKTELEEKMERSEQRVMQFFTEFKSDVFGKLDWVMGELGKYGRESVTTPRTLDEHGKILRDHEGRLKNLESTSH